MASNAGSLNSQPFYYGPGPNADTVSLVTSYLGLDEVMACSVVSQCWRICMDNHAIWSGLFDTEYVPSEPGQRTKEDFQYMYPRTATTRKKMALLGRFVGIMPNIDFATYTTYKTTMDPYDPAQKMDKTWEYVCKPPYLHRDYEEGDEELVKLLKTQGDFETTADPNELTKAGLLIPFTFRNLVVTANYVGVKKCIKVFGYIQSEVFNQCSKVPGGVKVHQMRTEAPTSTQNKAWAEQKAKLAQKGHQAVDLETRALYDALNILNKGTCPDRQQREDRCTFSRTSTTTKIGNNAISVIIGGFAPRGTGVFGMASSNAADGVIGAAPAVPAEVRSSGLGTLVFEKGT